jgi:hypothetical protein
VSAQEDITDLLPVDMCDIISASPAFSTAATESVWEEWEEWKNKWQVYCVIRKNKEVDSTVIVMLCNDLIPNS